MSNTIINVRFGLYHFQITKDWKFSIWRNEAHRGLPYGFFDWY